MKKFTIIGFVVVLIVAGVLLWQHFRPLINLVQSGTDLHLKNTGLSCTLHVTKRDGSSIHGIRLVMNTPPEIVTITADSGTIAECRDRNSVLITLNGEKLQTPKMQATTTNSGVFMLTR
jgi:hypothetical protein